MAGHKRIPSREGGIEIVVEELATMTASFSAAMKAAFGKYDVVHIHAEGPAAMCWIPKLAGKKVICTVHGDAQIISRKNIGLMAA